MELISWIATGFVLLSFLFDGWKLRLINSIGATLWLVWGIRAGEGSIIFLNAVIVLIHIYKLSIEGGEKSFFRPLKKIFKKTTRILSANTNK